MGRTDKVEVSIPLRNFVAVVSIPVDQPGNSVQKLDH